VINLTKKERQIFFDAVAQKFISSDLREDAAHNPMIAKGLGLPPCNCQVGHTYNPVTLEASYPEVVRLIGEAASFRHRELMLIIGKLCERPQPAQLAQAVQLVTLAVFNCAQTQRPMDPLEPMLELFVCKAMLSMLGSKPSTPTYPLVNLANIYVLARYCGQVPHGEFITLPSYWFWSKHLTGEVLGGHKAYLSFSEPTGACK